MSFQIRKATITDLETIVELFDLYRQFYQQMSDTKQAYAFLEARFKHSDSEIFVAETEHQLVGFVQLYPIFSSVRMQRLWLLNDIFVLKEFRGNGLSKSLIFAAQQLAKETKACGLLLETATDNLIGNQLYLAMGFELQSESNFYFLKL